MKPSLLIVNGENYWADYFKDYKVIRKKIQDSVWLWRNQQLMVGDAEGSVVPDAILWRVGAIEPSKQQETAMQLIALSGLPCVNSIACLQKGFDRLSMLNELKQLDFPMLPFQVVSKASLIRNIEISFPFVLKSGNLHGGLGKVLVKNEETWKDIQDLLYTSKDYVTIEPFLDYEKDIRYLAIGTKVWAMVRQGKYWKANTETTAFELFEPEPAWKQKTLALKAAIQADIVAIDVLEKDGKKYVVEYNDIPGLSGFPEQLKWALAETLIQKIRK